MSCIWVTLSPNLNYKQGWDSNTIPIIQKQHTDKSQIYMNPSSIRTRAQDSQTHRYTTEVSWQDESCNILSRNSTCLHCACCILKSIHIVQVLTIQDEGCKYFRSSIMRVCSPIYSNCLLPRTKCRSETNIIISSDGYRHIWLINSSTAPQLYIKPWKL